MPPVVRQESAGGVVVRSDGHVLLIRIRSRAGRSLWTFPKGRIEANETPEEAALREVREETGYMGEILESMGPPMHYRFTTRRQAIHKSVQWFLMTLKGKHGSYDPKEVEEARWVPIAEAFSKLSYRSDRQLLKKTEAYLRRKSRADRST